MENTVLIISLGISLLIAVINVIAFAVNNSSRGKKEAYSMGALQKTLENLVETVNEIKDSILRSSAEAKEFSERLFIVEQSAKSAHSRIDNLEKRKGA